MSKVILTILFLLIIIPAVIAEDQVVINSKDWRDVYSGTIYAHLNDLEVHYIAEETHGLQLIDEVLKRNLKSVLLIESEDKPYVFGYKPKLEDVGFEVEEYPSSDGEETNLELAKLTVDKKGINSFIVLDGSLGYGALSVAPYAVLTNSFVLFANNNNIDGVYDLLSKNAEKIILYGRVDREVKDRLADLNPEIINTGDRHKDNIEIAWKFLEQKSVKQIILTNGEVIEPGIFNDEFPVLFIGTSNVPNYVIDFIQGSDVRTAVVIGYELFDNAKKIREETGIKIFLKYGQGRNEQLYALDIFPLPSYNPTVEIQEMRYNTITRQLEVIFKNKGDVFAYAQALSHDLEVNGNSVAQVGDEEAFFLGANDVTTRTYDVDLIEYLDETIYAQSKVVLGDTPSSPVRLLLIETKVEIVSIEEDSAIEITDAVYNKGTKRFEITIKNVGEDDVYADADIIDLIIADEKTILSAELQKIGSGDEGVFKIKAALEEVDFADNPTIKVRVRYGAQENVLIKQITEEFDLIIRGTDYKLVAVVVMVLVVLWLLASIRKKKKKQK